MTAQTDIAKMSARRKNVPTGLELAARIREDGATVADLAAEYDVSRSTVSRSINDAGLSSADGRSTTQLRPENARTPVVSFAHLGYTEELDGAACVDHPRLTPDHWFPSTLVERRGFGEAAKAACGGCPVRLTCLARALDEEGDGPRYGIRGGLDEDERAELVESGAA